MDGFSGENHSLMRTDLHSYFPMNPYVYHPQMTCFTMLPPPHYNLLQNPFYFPDLNPSISSVDSKEPRQMTPTESPRFQIKKLACKAKTVPSEKEVKDQEQFTVKLGKNDIEATVSYKKKNTESNIVNQTFSFLITERSASLAAQYFKFSEEKVKEYYKVMAKVKLGGKKYINRKYLKRLLAFEYRSEFERAFTKAKISLLTLEEIRTAIRVLMFSFLRGSACQTLLTSSKIYKETLPEHFWRKRKISDFLFVGQPSTTL